MKKQVSFQTFSYFYKKAQHCADKESFIEEAMSLDHDCLLYTSPSPRDA